MPVEPSFEIVTEPTKVAYEVGDSLDLTGISCKYVDAYGVESIVGADDVEGSPELFEEAGDPVEVTVTYMGLSDTYNVVVTE